MRAAHTRPTRPLRAALGALAVAAAVGCGQGPVVALPTDSLRDVALDAPIGVPPAEGAVWLRVRAAASERACLQLDEVTTDAGEALVAPGEGGPWCRRCRRRTAIVPGSGAFALPVGVGALTVRVGLRDCDTMLTPSIDRALASPLRVEVIARPELARGRLAVQPVVAVEGAASEALDALTRAVDPWFDAAGVALAWQAPCRVDGPSEPAAVGPTEAASLAPAKALADARCGRDPRALRVYFVRALAWTDPLTGETASPPGIATAIPAGLGDGAAVDGVLVAVGGALGDARQAPGLAVTVAHELGHALGLFHSVELDGTADDLADTDGHDLMNPVGAALADRRFTPAQAARLRQHPLVQP